MKNMSWRKILLNRAGFSLIELLVVMVIIGLLAALVGPKFFSKVDKAHVVAARAQIKNFENALMQYRLDKHKYPTSSDGLSALKPEYMRQIPKDPWDNPYIYKYPSEHNGEFDLMSHGRDGVQGGEGFDKDVVNWEESN